MDLGMVPASMILKSEGKLPASQRKKENNVTEGLRCESIIQKMPLFTSLEDVERDHLLTSARCLELPPDTILMHEGDRGDHCYFILSGELEILKNLGTADQQILNVRGRGHCVGEISLLNPDKPRSASVRTRTQARLLEMTRETFRSILNRHPAFAHDLACYMSSCLCESNETSLRELKKKSRQLAVAYKDLQEARAQATGKERLERELEIAWEIQQNILPSTPPSIEGLDMGARMLPARVVGGDFFDIIRLDAETLGIAVGDVSGKGIAAAIFMAMTCSFLRAEAKRATSPRRVLQRVNQHLLQMDKSDMFVTVLYGILETSLRSFRYVRAGHEVPLLVQSDGEALMLPRVFGQALGFLQQPELDEQTTVLSPGDTLLIYSDGITEATNPAGELFGRQRLQKAALKFRHRSAQEVCDFLVETVLSYQGKGDRSDDLTLFAMVAN